MCECGEGGRAVSVIITPLCVVSVSLLEEEYESLHRSVEDKRGLEAIRKVSSFFILNFLLRYLLSIFIVKTTGKQD